MMLKIDELCTLFCESFPLIRHLQDYQDMVSGLIHVQKIKRRCTQLRERKKDVKIGKMVDR